MAQQEHDIDPFKVSSPRIFLVRMMLFLVLGALLIIVLYKQIWAAFLADPGLAIERSPTLLAPMQAILRDRMGRMAISPQTMRGLMDSIATRLDEARDISRYMTGLLVFLGLLGTF